MQNKSVEDLYNDGLKEILYAERKILQALPKMSAAATSDKLTAAFDKHRKETEGHVSRLEKVFATSGQPVVAKTCAGIDAIIEEGELIIADYKNSPALDLGLAAGAQAVEHYEIAKYKALKKLAASLGNSDAAELLDATLQQEMQTEADLDALADALDGSKVKR
ncbi:MULTISPECIES: YciE/YciF ferroxidase family protein [unclassified Phyllobacterium]|uniref:YciE/YciF ferroxidase family protein n=1 Tax=unclassified Phyllobacterium TaxID=2638441 RepID=UPI003012BC56